MLQQILKDMYIDPDVLDGLNEDQKKILFLKMRQEQVRRWKEREEKLEKEGGGGLKPKPKKGPSKNVSWLLGCDGDVQVNVIGEVDELRSSALILNNRRSSGLHCNPRNQTVVRSNLVNRTSSEQVMTVTDSPSALQSGIQLHFKGVSPAAESCQEAPPTQEKDEVLTIEPQLLPLQDEFCTTNSTPSNNVLQEEQETSPPVEPEEEDDEVDDDDDDDEKSDPCLFYRPHFGLAKMSSETDECPQRQGDGQSDTNGSLPHILQEKGVGPLAYTNPRDSEKMDKGKDASAATALCQMDTDEAGKQPKGTPVGRGRVAQLMKTFNAPSNPVLPKRPKPPLPNKPAHLVTSPSIR